MDFPRKIRKVQRIVGCEVTLHEEGADRVLFAWRDPDTLIATQKIVGKGKKAPELALRKLHSEIYRANGQLAYIRQEGKCCFCGVKMPANSYEVDHKHGRGRGRSDRVDDLQACCTGFNGCDGHRRKHGG